MQYKFLFHGTNLLAAKSIAREGLHAGWNDAGQGWIGRFGGGRRGLYKIPTISGTTSFDEAKEYGNVIFRFPFNRDVFNEQGSTASEWMWVDPEAKIDPDDIVYFILDVDGYPTDDEDNIVDPYDESEGFYVGSLLWLK